MAPTTPRRRISDMRVAELRLELEKRNLESKGLKGTLIQRLQQAIKKEEQEKLNTSSEENKEDEIILKLKSPSKAEQNIAENDEIEQNNTSSEEILETSNPEINLKLPETEKPETIFSEPEIIKSAPVNLEKDNIEIQQEEQVDKTPEADDKDPINDVQSNEEVSSSEPVVEEETVVEEEVIADHEKGPKEEHVLEDEDMRHDEEQSQNDDAKQDNDNIVDNNSTPLAQDDQTTEIEENVLFSNADNDDQIESPEEKEVINEDQEVVDEDSVLDSSVPESNVAQTSNLSEDERYYLFSTENDPKEEEVCEENIPQEQDEDEGLSEDQNDTEEVEEFEQDEVIEESEITEEYVAYVTVDENEQQDENVNEEKVEESKDEDGDQTPNLEEDDSQYSNDAESKNDLALKEDPIDENSKTGEESGAMDVDEQLDEEEDNEDLVAIEEDVLDMLDYDIEVPDNQHARSESRDKNEENNKARERNIQARKSQKSVSSDGKRNSQSEPSSTQNEKTAMVKKEGLGETKNLWISGLSASTRASELKVAFSRYGKVVGAKVVTNAKTPGSKCFGFVAMSTADAANKCILHLNKTEMHGRYITVERTRSDPSASKKSTTSEALRSTTSSQDKNSEINLKKEKTPIKGVSDVNKKDENSPKTNNNDRMTDKTDKFRPKSIKREDSRSEASKKLETRRRTQSSVSSYRNRLDNKPLSRAGIQTGDKRGNEIQRGSTSRRSSLGEPIRKRPRNPDGRREVVIDNKAGELSLRVNVSSNSGDNRASNISVMNRLKRSPPLRERITRVTNRSDRPNRAENAISRQNNFGRQGAGLQRQNMGLNRQNVNISRQGTAQYRQNTSSRQGTTLAQAALQRSRKYIPERRHNRDRGAMATVSNDNATSFNKREAIRSNRVFSTSLDRSRQLLKKEREQRELLQLEREKLERERRQLEKDRQERERLERERSKLEQERKLELEKIGKAKAEMRRLQEINRFEQAQRQRAIKRSYDAVPTTTRRTQSNTDKRGDRDDRRSGGYQYETRDSGSPQVRNDQETYRSSRATERSTQQSQSQLTRGLSKSMLSSNQDYHDVDRRREVIAPQDTDARYGNDIERKVKKYERPERNSTKIMDYDRRSGAANASTFSREGREIRDSRTIDDRKVVQRERPSRSSRSPMTGYRRGGNTSSSTTRKESALWRDTTVSSSKRRPTDRDLREDAHPRGVSDYESGRKSERSGRKMGDQSEIRHHSSHGSSSRSGSQKYRTEAERHAADMNFSSKRSPVGPAASGKPIPTTARAGSHQQPDPWSPWQQQQQQPSRGESSSLWTGSNSVQAPPLGVPPALVGFNGVQPTEHTHIQGLPTGLSILPPHGTYFAPNRPPSDSRYDGYKNIRRF